jgi:iron(III) transport system ATP-binding protein
VVCLLGPSGCGKTTALRIAAGLEPLQQGVVSLGGRVVADGDRAVPPEERNVGLVFQDYALFPHISVLDNVAFGLRDLPQRDREEMAHRALEQVAMGDYAEAFPHVLSGGQQQRVALARALAPQPRVMLLDEPFSGLDWRLRDEIRDQALHVLKKSEAATLLVTHDPEEAMFMADRIALMRAGRIVQVGPPTELYFKPADAFVAAFFGDINRLERITTGGKVETPLGHLATPDLADGTAVEVLVRPEAIKLLPPGDHAGTGKAPARVMAARLLGRTSLVHLSVGNGSEHGLHLHARVPGRFLPSEGETFNIDLDFALAYVFPLAETT